MSPHLRRRRWLWLLVGPGLLLFAGGLLAQTEPPATPDPNVWISPTPESDGAIRIIVQPNDSLWQIAARAGLTLQELLTLNNLTESAIIQPGQQLIIGFGQPGAPAVPTEALTPTVTLLPPTLAPTEAPPQAAICLSAFDDADRDGRRSSGEPLKAGVVFTVYDSRTVVANYITDGLTEPHCLEGLLPGEYRVTRSVAPGETLTTGGNWALQLGNGGRLEQAFGSYTTETTASPAATPVQAGVEPSPIAQTSPPTGVPDAPNRRALVIGLAAALVLLLASAVLIFLLWRKLLPGRGTDQNG